jgi:hypothetical protein
MSWNHVRVTSVTDQEGVIRLGWAYLLSLNDHIKKLDNDFQDTEIRQWKVVIVERWNEWSKAHICLYSLQQGWYFPLSNSCSLWFQHSVLYIYSFYKYLKSLECRKDCSFFIHLFILEKIALNAWEKARDVGWPMCLHNVHCIKVTRLWFQYGVIFQWSPHTSMCL